MYDLIKLAVERLNPPQQIVIISRHIFRIRYTRYIDDFPTLAYQTPSLR